jgi:lysyl-tRNA synthetase class I
MYWQEHCFAEQKDERELDPLLMKAKMCKVVKTGIKYRSRLYWHKALGGFVGKRVSVRSVPTYAPPDEIQVFADGIWICTAFATDSEVCKAVTAKDVRNAQREQREQIRERISEARETVRQVDAEIAALQPATQVKTETVSTQKPEQEKPVDAQHTEMNRDNKEIQTPHSPDLFDILKAHYNLGQP